MNTTTVTDTAQNSIGAVIKTGKKSRGIRDGATQGRYRGVLALDEKTTLVGVLQTTSTDLKASVDAANTLIMALDPATSTEANIEAALDAYEALTVLSIESALRAVVKKLRA